MKSYAEFTFDVLSFNYKDIKTEFMEYYGIEDCLTFKIVDLSSYVNESNKTVLKVVVEARRSNENGRNINLNTEQNIHSLSSNILNELKSLNDEKLIDYYLKDTYSWSCVHASKGIATICLDQNEVAVLSHPKYNFKVVPAYKNGPAKIIKQLKTEENKDMDKSQYQKVEQQMQHAKQSVLLTGDGIISISTDGAVTLKKINESPDISDMVSDIEDILHSETGTEKFLEDVEKFKEKRTALNLKLEYEFNTLVGRYNEYYKNSLNMIEYDPDSLSVSFVKTGRVIYFNLTNIVNVSRDPQYYLINNDFFIHHSKVDDEFRAKYVVDDMGFNIHDETIIDFPFKTVKINGALMVIEKLDM